MIKGIEVLRKYFIQISVLLLILLWVYAAVSKLSNFTHFKEQMHLQVLYPFLQTVSIYLLPPAELLISLLLCFERTVNKGLFFSLIFLLLFTGYVALATFHFFTNVPCSCGGILEHISWRSHLFLNLFFLALTISSIIFLKKGAAVTKQIK
ncbi:MauE/DoxX family redox-associated membrane protein [Mucilaginibacter sp. UYCu711]|uniref:MauE/DoxX family redox-associated membrane protein n=1 Tax=Mucilaginibacter sp. UYCu711 TaxID=3156339 RepID=UPI003D24B1FD